MRFLLPVLHGLLLLLGLALPKYLKAIQLAPKLGPEAILPLLLIDGVVVLVAELAFLGGVVLLSERWRMRAAVAWSALLLIFGMYFAADLRFFQASGAPMDLPIFLHGLRYLDQLIGLVAAEITWQWGLANLLAIAGGVGLLRLSARVAPLQLPRWGAAFSLLLAFTGLLAAIQLQNQPRPQSPLALISGNLFLEQTQLVISRTLEALAPQDLSYPVPEPVQVALTPASQLDNVVIILLESIRASATTPYAPALDSTPFLARIAREGATVQRAYVTLPHTTKALVSVLSGYPPDIRRPLSETTSAGIPGTGIARILKSVGYSSAYFHSAYGDFENNDVLVRNLGYDLYVAREKLDQTRFESPNYLGLEDRAMLQPIMNWIDQTQAETPRKPFLLSVLTLVSHHDYKIPSTFPRRTWPGSERWNDYLNSVHYVDTFVGELFAEFERRDLLKNTLFIFLGDHGEGHGEHGRKGHDQIPYEEGLHIPMLLYSQRLFPQPTQIEGLRWNIDVLPTVLDALKLKVVQGQLEGKSLFTPVPERVIYSSCWIEDQCITRIEGSEKYIHFYGKQKDEFYRLDSDPEERKNLIATVPEEQQKRYIAELLSWRTHVRKVYTTHALLHSEGYVSVKRPSPDAPLQASFSDKLELVGYDVPEPLLRGKTGKLILYYGVKSNLVGGWRVKAELQNEQGEWRDVRLKLTYPSIEMESLAPQHYYRMQYELSVLSRAQLGDQNLRVYVEVDKNKRREVKGLNAYVQDRVALLPIEVASD